MVQFPKTVLPFHFGAPERRLFGCLHQPGVAQNRKCAVVICQPMGHEYVNCHRALRQLAVNLATAGFPVLRFDYYGCGDSAGDAIQGGIGHWLEDISTAIAEVRRRTSLRQVCLVGLRLGGALAAMAGAQLGDLENLVLWDPVFEGKSYLQGLQDLQKEMLRFRPKPARNKSEEYVELLGFPLSSFLYSELQKLDLGAMAEKPAHNVFILRSEPTPRGDRLKDCLTRTDARVECQQLDIPQIWLPTANGSLLVPRQALQAVVSWTCRMNA